MAEVFPHIDFRREVTIGHLMLDVTAKAAELAKVNPPIRPREDVESLWQTLLDGERRLGRQRPRLLPPRAERSAEELPRQHLARQVGLRRHRVPAAGAGQRRHEARHVLQPDGASDEPGIRRSASA